MLFNSFDFLLFLAIVLPLQALLPHRPRNVFLLGASYLFYGAWDWRLVSLLLVSTLLDYVCAIVIDGSSSRNVRRGVLLLSMAGNLGLLGVFKYAGFFVESMASFLGAAGVEPHMTTLNIILPVGISFYTFQTMSYTIDVYRREIRPERNILDYALYVAFFPQLVAGPIERAGRLIPQLKRRTRPTIEQLRAGGWLVLWGLFKKMVIADNLAPVVTRALADQASLGGAETLIALYCFAIYLYADFSGYTDIARGVAKLMGYELMLNFRLPYFARNPLDFWSRWHISLSTWLRDYLFLPLARRRRIGISGALVVTMLLAGLWHGASWQFVAWGAYHGVLLAIYAAVRRRSWFERFTTRVPHAIMTLVAVLFMFHLTCLGWLIVGSATPEILLGSLRAIVTMQGPSALAWEWAWLLAVVTAPLLFVQSLQARYGDLNVMLRLSIPARVLCYSVLLFGIVTLGAIESPAFFYFRF